MFRAQGYNENTIGIIHFTSSFTGIQTSIYKETHPRQFGHPWDTPPLPRVCRIWDRLLPDRHLDISALAGSVVQSLQYGLLMRRQGLGERHKSLDPFHGYVVDGQDNVILLKSGLSQNAVRIQRCDGDPILFLKYFVNGECSKSIIASQGILTGCDSPEEPISDIFKTALMDLKVSPENILTVVKLTKSFIIPSFLRSS